VLDEVSSRRPFLERLRREEVIGDAVLLSRPGVPRGGRYRELELRYPLEQAADQRALANTGRTGDDEDLGTVRHR
jgi:hypothetical protein